MHSLHVTTGRRDLRISPSDYIPFDFGTIASAVAFDEQHNWLWCNDAAARSVASMEPQGVRLTTPETLRGINSRKLFGEAYMEERMGLLQPVLESGQPTQYVEFTWGQRVRTRVWELNPETYGRRGWFALVKPENVSSTPEGAHLPLLVSSQLGALADLTTRELIVMRLIAMGMSAKEVAKHEFRSVKTIENQIAGIHTKLGLGNRAELVRFACERGLIAFSDEEWNEIAAGRRASATLAASLDDGVAIIGSIPISNAVRPAQAKDPPTRPPIIVVRDDEP